MYLFIFAVFKGVKHSLFLSFNLRYFECPPYNSATIRSIYHVRNVEVYKLKQVCKKYIMEGLRKCKSNSVPKCIVIILVYSSKESIIQYF